MSITLRRLRMTCLSMRLPLYLRPSVLFFSPLLTPHARLPSCLRLPMFARWLGTLETSKVLDGFYRDGKVGQRGAFRVREEIVAENDLESSQSLVAGER